MKITIIEPFFTSSHKQWAEGFQSHSEHEIQVLSLSGKHWKWRMYGGAVSLAKQFLALKELPDLILASDMLDLTTFLALTKAKSAKTPTAIYFHENQLTYPWNYTPSAEKEQRDYSFINYISALVADRVFFNSFYHKDSFLSALPRFLKSFPDYTEVDNVEKIIAKSQVLPLGLDLSKFQKYRTEPFQKLPLIVWNHRWEYDKNPAAFFDAMYHLKDAGLKFELVVLGERYSRIPPCFDEAAQRLKMEIIHFGYAENFGEYAQWLWKADILPVTSNQDFFGGSVVEAMYCNCFPILPNRLAYPEHIDAKLHKRYFYDTNKAFLSKLVWAVQNIDSLKQQSVTYKSKIINYDWKILGPIYDAAMMEV